MSIQRKNPGEENAEATVDDLVEKRNMVITQDAKENVFRARCGWKYLGERGIKYFNKIPKRNRASVVQNEMFVVNAESENRLTLSRVTKEMLGNCHRYFEGLYQRVSKGIKCGK